jgi:ubiquinone/menaquinone biosynthesis C-methylase UbiE
VSGISRRPGTHGNGASGIDYDRRYAKIYGEEAGQYDENRFGGRRGRFDRDYKNAVILNVLRGRGLLAAENTIIDIAAGTGRITHYLAARSSAVIVAIDISKEMLALNECGLPAAARSRVEYRVMSVKELDLPDGTADGATLGSFLYLIPREDYAAYTSDIRRILKPGGILVAEVANALGLVNPRNFVRVAVHRHLRRKRVKSHVYPWEVRRLFPGFDLEEVVGASYPVVSKRYETYAGYSRAMGRSPGLKHLGGKCTLVLRRH